MARRLTTRESWEQVHDRLRRRSSYPQPRRHLMDCELERVFRAHLGALRGGTILEAGCGSSRWLPYLARELGMSVAGIDYSEAGIAGARANLELHGVTGELITGDLFAQAKEGHPRVDAAFSLGLLEHFEDPREALAAVCTFVRPGGAVISLVPNVAGVILRASCRANPGLRESYVSLDRDGWAEVHRACGLEVVEAYYAQFFDWTWLHLGALPGAVSLWLSRLFRVVALPLVWMGGRSGRFVRSQTWCAAIVVVGRKPGP